MKREKKQKASSMIVTLNDGKEQLVEATEVGTTNEWFVFLKNKEVVAVIRTGLVKMVRKA